MLVVKAIFAVWSHIGIETLKYATFYCMNYTFHSYFIEDKLNFMESFLFAFFFSFLFLNYF